MNWQKNWANWRGRVVFIDENNRVRRGTALDATQAEQALILVQLDDENKPTWQHPRTVFPDVFLNLSENNLHLN